MNALQVTRRGFFGVAAAAATMTARTPFTTATRTRAEIAYELRTQAALANRNAATALSVSNGDEARYERRSASFTKGLPHDEDGEVDRASYEQLLVALEHPTATDFESIPVVGPMKLGNPQAALSFDLQGPDPQQLSIPPAPRFDSREQAAEAAECYWQALARDVPFVDYGTDPLTNAAAADIRRFHDGAFGAFVSPYTLFRGTTEGDIAGPYLSQFLVQDVPCGELQIAQRVRQLATGRDWAHQYGDWLALQRGFVPEVAPPRPDARRGYVRNGRDLATYVRNDPLYMLFVNAALILLGNNTPVDPSNPYRFSRNQSGFVTFGGPAVLDLVARVANSALRATWYQKWLVHRRLRPEEFGGRLHAMLAQHRAYPIDEAILSSPAMETVFRQRGTYLLPQAYPDGAPVHPSYPGGHAAVAGACVTVLKAYFDEDHLLPNPMVVSRDGMTRIAVDTPLHVGGELNKLASNVSLGRNFAGIHWRSDHDAGLRLGEAVAIGVMRDMKDCFHEHPRGMTLTTFDGTRIAV